MLIFNHIKKTPRLITECFFMITTYKNANIYNLFRNDNLFNRYLVILHKFCQINTIR